MRKILCLGGLIPIIIAGISGCQSSRQEMLENANAGSAFHQAALANAYLNGYGFTTDYEQAAKWADEAAQQNEPDGIYISGIISDYGLGTRTIDKKRADELYRKAIPGLQAMVRKGSVVSIYNLGTAYLYGRGVPQDYSAARILLEAASRKSFAPAYAKLGLIFLNGWGVKADRSQAKELLLRAAPNGVPEAQCALAASYLDANNLTAAKNWYHDAAVLNYPPALTALAEMTRDGIGVEKDRQAALDLFRRAAASHYPPAMLQTADIYRFDPNSRDQAFSLLIDAIGKDFAPACLPLAELYFDMRKDKPEYSQRAMVLYQLAANFGSTENIRDRMIELDRATPLFYFITLGLKDVKTPSAYLKYDSAISSILAIHQGGKEKNGHQLFQQMLQREPLPLYFSNAWFEIYRANLPMAWAGEIFQAVAGTQAKQSFFWICYGTCANLAGRPELAMTAVSRLERIAPGLPSPSAAAELKVLASIIRTEALIQRGMENEAYSRLAENGRITPVNPPLLNYIRTFAPLVLKDRKRFEAATGIDIKSEEPIAVVIPTPQPFYDFSVNAITLPQAPIPEPVLRSEVRFIPTNH